MHILDLSPYRRPIQILTPILLVGLILFLFRGWMEQGMEMDEVSRVSNIIPIFNPDAQPADRGSFRVTAFGITFPIMFKEYISSAYLIKFLPLGLFNDYLLGIRLLHLCFFLLAALSFFFFAQKHHLYVAVWTSLLMVTAPLLYPMVRIGFVETIHLFFLTAAAFLIYRFIQHPDRRGSLFWGVFVLSFAVNQSFYVIWVVAGTGLATLLLYPDVWRRCCQPIRNLATAALAAVLGLAHFVYYNLASGFPTVATAYYYLFDRERYNQNPVDRSIAQPFLEELRNKFVHLDVFYGPYSEAYWLMGLIMTAIFLFSFAKSLRAGRLRQDRIYFLPFLSLAAVLALILISPKGTRPGHYTYIIPFEQLSMISALLLTARMLPWSSLAKGLLHAVPALLFLFNFYNSNQIVAENNRTGGTALFSPAVFEFNDYLSRQRIDSRNIYFLSWGLYAQPYFLQRGEFHINNWVYHLIDKQPAEQAESLKFLFSSSQARPATGDQLYFPLFAQKRSDINETLQKVVAEYSGRLALEKTFFERDASTPAILLYRLDGARQFLDGFADGVLDSGFEEALAIAKYGPHQVEAGREEDLAMWFIADNLAPTTKVVFEGLILRTVFSGDHCTALVPYRELVQSGSFEVFLHDQARKIRSSAVLLEVEAPDS